jgi:excisionase family DNA binding protein
MTDQKDLSPEARAALAVFLDFFTLKEVAERVALTPLLVRRAITSGELRARRIGKGGWRIARADVDAWITGGLRGIEASTDRAQ